ncbi:MAG TPA: nucleoside permease [Phycisphaerales bacterium]|nr:nucleoside permease [Phycisphaerales bacterium]
MTDHTAHPGSMITAKLSAMMFLQFFLWGAWYVTVGNYMGEHHMGRVVSWAYTVGPIAAIISPFFLGMVADRFFATERVLAVMHLLGGAFLFAAPFVVPDSAESSPWPFIGMLMLHMLCYMPTLGLTNTLAFHNMSNPEKQFPRVRVWGTIGWIVAGLVIALLAAIEVPETASLAGAELNAARNALPLFFYLAGASGVLLGLYSFFLPHTPPPARGKAFSARDALGLDALSLMKHPSFAVFVLCSLLTCIPLAAYYAFAPVYANDLGMADVPFKMSFGQMSEIFFMVVMPFFFARFGVKWMLLVGMLAWVARYGLFSGAADGRVMWMAILGIALHGICYDFFFVTGFIYTDKRAPKSVRGAAQGLLVLVTQGLGLGLGAQIVGWLKNSNTDAGVTDWRTVWLIPCLFAAGVAVVFFLFFRDRVTATPEEVGDAPLQAGDTETAV